MCEYLSELLASWLSSDPTSEMMTAPGKLTGLSADLSVDPLLSTQIGEFIVQERIGSGGMGVVYRATHPLIGKQVAIKVLRADIVSEQQVERLLIEARAVNAIRHPGIIDIFGFGSLPDGRPYIIMELLHGYSLSGLIRKSGRLDIGTTVRILDEMLAALGAAHRAGVVHRDLKPGNVFMAETASGTHAVKLVDFGIAKLVQSQEGPTTLEGTLLGTPEFMAPEQIRGAPSSPAIDLYAVGVIAFQMLTGERPFKGEPFQVLFAHVELPPPVPSSRNPDIPPEFDTLVLQLLAKDPALRPSSAEAVRQALQRVPLTALQPKHPRQEPPAPIPTTPEGETWTTQATTLPRTLSVNRKPHWAIGLALVAVLGGGGFLLWPPHTSHIQAAEPAPEVPPSAPLVQAPETAPAPIQAEQKALPSEAVRPDRLSESVAQPPAEVAQPASSTSGGAFVQQAQMPKPQGEGNMESTGDSSTAEETALQAQEPSLPVQRQAPAPKKAPVESLTKELAQRPKASFGSRKQQLEAQIKRLDELRTLYQEKAPSPDDASELERLSRFAANIDNPEALTTGNLEDLKTAIDKLDPEPAPPPVSIKSDVSSSESEETAPAQSTGPTEALAKFKDNQLKRITKYKQVLTQRAGSSPSGTHDKAIQKLDEIRELANSMESQDERQRVRNDLDAFEIEHHLKSSD